MQLDRRTFPRLARWLCLSAIAIVATVVPCWASPSLGLPVDIVVNQAEPGSIAIVQNRHAAPILVDRADWAGVIRAASDLQADIERVTGVKPELRTEPRGA